MQRGGYIINVARGGHLVLPDFVAAIKDGQLAGATLDVFETEPLRPDHEIWLNPSIRITPHISASTILDLSVRQIAAKIRALNAGKPVSGMVLAARGY
ncbi:hypothetical protein A6456_37405 [Paraburkholderia tropica]|nr:hypothetical protein A6456_37405 [Paraburkholderia tropica]